MKNNKVYRNQDDELVAGVCSGLAEYFEIDATLIRIIFIVLGISGGSGILIYLILWLLIPRKDKIKIEKEIEGKAEIIAKKIKKEVKTEKRSGNFFGMILVIIGGALLIEEVAPKFINWDYFWPVTLMTLGFYLIFRKR